jgi:hypothetical protein
LRPGFANPGDDGAEKETPITGSDLEQASAAALDHLGEGRVTDTEVGDEESYYEVEVTLDDGTQVDVQLDESFNMGTLMWSCWGFVCDGDGRRYLLAR